MNYTLNLKTFIFKKKPNRILNSLYIFTGFYIHHIKQKTLMLIIVQETQEKELNM